MAQMRTWSDSSGKHQMKAKFVEVTDGKVKLEREDGSEFSIELKKLSDADQKYVAEQQGGDDPFKAVPSKKKATKRDEDEEEQPRPVKRKRSRPVEENEEDAESESPGKLVKPKWSNATAIPLTPSKEKWSVKIAAPAESETPRRTRAIPLPPKVDFFEGAKALVVNAACGRAVVGYNWDKHGAGSHTRLVVCSIEKGKLLTTATTSGVMVPLALRDNGFEVVMCSDEFGFGKHDRLELWKLTPSGITREFRWTPYDDIQGAERDVKWAQFIDADRLATMSAGGRLAIWSMEKVQPICYLDAKAAGGCIPAISPDRKYIVFAADKDICVLDIEAQEVVALLTPPKMTFPQFAFTPKGTRLACGALDRIYVWDFATGNLYREISTYGIHLDSVICPSEDHVLAGKQMLFDMESQVKLWNYQGGELAALCGSACLFEVSGFGQSPAGALVSATIPQPGVQEALKKAMADPEFFVLRPGTAVRLDVSALTDAAEREKAQGSLTQKLTANGFVVDPGGTITLVASTETGKQTEIAYRSIGFGMHGVRIYKFQEYTSRLRFVYNGKEAWNGRCGNEPGFVHLKQGESMEQVLRQHEMPNYAYFQSVELPKLLTKPTGAPTVGASQVTISGVR
jgi:hypothetical protein